MRAVQGSFRPGLTPDSGGPSVRRLSCCRMGEATASRHTPERQEPEMAKVLCVLYDDPVDGSPASYARDDIPQIKSYPGGQTTPSPHAVDFVPGHLLGSVSGEL